MNVSVRDGAVTNGMDSVSPGRNFECNLTARVLALYMPLRSFAIGLSSHCKQVVSCRIKAADYAGGPAAGIFLQLSVVEAHV